MILPRPAHKFTRTHYFKDLAGLLRNFFRPHRRGLPLPSEQG